MIYIFFLNHIFKFTRMKTATVTVDWFQQKLGFFFLLQMNKYIKVTPYSKRNSFSDIRWRVFFFYKDAVMSGCHLDLKLDNVTGMYSTYLKIKATRDFIKDNNQVHQLGFQPLPGFPHAMWENYTIAPITVRKYYNDYTQVPKV